MSRHFIFKVIVPILALIIIICGVYLYILQISKNTANDTLQSLGFTQSNITETRYQKGRAFHLNIKLDDEGLNSAKLLSTPIPLIGNMLGNKSDQTRLFGLTVTGRASRATGLDITSWASTQLNLLNAPPLLIKDATIDLSTPLGGLRFNIEADIASFVKNTRDIVLNISTRQYELKFNSVWEGKINRSGHWQYDITINDAGFNTDKAQASRVSGWLSAEKSNNALFPELSGQLKMGMLSLSPITLHNADLTFDGRPGSMTTILLADIAGYEDMALSLDIKPDGTSKLVNALIETSDADDLLSLMTRLHDVKIWEDSEGNISSLMLTEGNLSALYDSLQPIKAEKYQLQISGTPLNLAGKIIAITTKDGIPQRHIISLDPAERSQ